MSRPKQDVKMNAAEVIEKYFIEGTDVSAEECLSSGYASLWKQRQSHQDLFVICEDVEHSGLWHLRYFLWDGVEVEHPHWVSVIKTMPLNYMKRFLSYADIPNDEELNHYPLLSLIQALNQWNSSYVFHSPPQNFQTLEEVLSFITGEEIAPEEEEE